MNQLAPNYGLQSANDKYLLYIDILGFRKLVESGQDARVRDILSQISRMHAHKDKHFPVIMFSDTVLIYNGFCCNGADEHRFVVNELAGFSADLFSRLNQIDAHYRGVIRRGEFNHEKINGKEFFFGKVLIECYDAEKELPGTGLFLDRQISVLQNYYTMGDWNDKYVYVHLTRAIEDLAYHGIPLPLDENSILFEELIPDTQRLAAEFQYLNDVYRSMLHHPSEKVREKHENTWTMLHERYGETLAFIEQSGHELRGTV